jgi:2-keto-3-deoxy-L-rhamnonate aldolase RhmA
MIDVKNRGHGEDHHEHLVRDVAKASLETGTAAGYVCLSEDSVKQRIAEGFRFIHYGFDHMMLMQVMKEHKALFKSLE